MQFHRFPSDALQNLHPERTTRRALVAAEATTTRQGGGSSLPLREVVVNNNHNEAPIVVLRDTDVICGEKGKVGKRYARSKGNRVFSKYLITMKDRYSAAPHGKKIMVAEALVDSLRKQNVRFLNRDPKNGAWTELDYKKCVDKTVSSFSRTNRPDPSTSSTTATNIKAAKKTNKQARTKVASAKKPTENDSNSTPLTDLLERRSRKPPPGGTIKIKEGRKQKNKKQQIRTTATVPTKKSTENKTSSASAASLEQKIRAPGEQKQKKVNKKKKTTSTKLEGKNADRGEGAILAPRTSDVVCGRCPASYQSRPQGNRIFLELVKSMQAGYDSAPLGRRTSIGKELVERMIVDDSVARTRFLHYDYSANAFIELNFDQCVAKATKALKSRSRLLQWP